MEECLPETQRSQVKFPVPDRVAWYPELERWGEQEGPASFKVIFNYRSHLRMV